MKIEADMEARYYFTVTWSAASLAFRGVSQDPCSLSVALDRQAFDAPGSALCGDEKRFLDLSVGDHILRVRSTEETQFDAIDLIPHSSS